MDKEAIIRQLPEICPEHVTDYTYDRYLQELGGHLAIYKRVSYSEPVELKQLMGHEDWEKPRRKWAAQCTCTCCQNDWYTQWLGGPLKEIAVCVGEDGLTYPVFDTGVPDTAPMMTEVSSNDGIICPVCGEGVTLIHASEIKTGTTRRLSMCSIENVGTNTALMYWLAYRHLDPDGLVYEEVSPWYAFVLDEKGKLVCFSYTQQRWRLSKNIEDPFYKKYASGDGDIYNYRKGGFVCNQVPDLIGCTGEKTGLGEYVRQGGTFPLLYLRTWQKKPAIENLINAGWELLIESMFLKLTGYGDHEVFTAELPAINWESTKPHEMLWMDKAAYRRLDRSANDHRRQEWFDGWKAYIAAGGRLDAYEFDKYWCKFTQYGMNTVLELMTAIPGLDIPKITKYLSKQFLELTEIRILADTWRMTTVLTGRDTLTQEEMWPRNLQDRHDRLTAMYLAEKGKDSWMLYLAGFRRILNKYRDLQWTDGELEIILPKDNGDLVREGETLRHCVGTYGEAHVTERQTIFFVRRHRRPERCYYTLSMNMQGIPKRVQLHGYGNERHGDHKQYKHSIPRKVLDFCDRWEADILMPWYRAQLQKQKEDKLA